MKLVKVFLFAIIATVLTSCATVTKEPVDALKNGENPWYFKGAMMDGQFTKTFKKPERITLIFRENGIVTGRRLVNSYFGQVEFIDQNGIRFSKGFGQTMRSGSKVSLARDKYYLELLVSTERFYIKNNKLFLTSEDGDVVLIFARPVKSQQ